MKRQTELVGWPKIARTLGIFGVALAGGLLVGCTEKNPSYCEPPGSCPEEPLQPDLALYHPERHDLQGGQHDLAPGRDMAARFDPGAAGPEKTVSFELQVPVGRGSVAVTVIGPSDDGQELTLRAAPHPLVLISPGFTVDRKQYATYGTRLASYGLVAVLQKPNSEFSHSQYRDDTNALLGWLAKPVGAGAQRVKDRLDLTRLGLAGHSLGGKISILIAAKDSRVKALLGIDPVDISTPAALKEIDQIKLPAGIPMAFLGETTSKMGGAMPCTPAAGNYEVLYRAANAPAFALTFIDAAHNDFVDNFAMCPTCTLCPGGSAPKVRTNQLAVKYTAAYFLWTLAGDARAREYFSGADFQNDLTAGYITRAAK